MQKHAEPPKRPLSTAIHIQYRHILSLSYVSLRSTSLAANLKRVNIAEALRILAESPLCAREDDPHESVTLVAADTAERKEPAGTGEAQAVEKALEDKTADLAVFEADTTSSVGSATAASGPVQVIEADDASCGDGQGDELDIRVVTGLVGSRVTAADRCEAHNVDDLCAVASWDWAARSWGHGYGDRVGGDGDLRRLARLLLSSSNYLGGGGRRFACLLWWNGDGGRGRGRAFADCLPAFSALGDFGLAVCNGFRGGT